MWATEHGEATAVDGTMDSPSTVDSLEAERATVGGISLECLKYLKPH